VTDTTAPASASTAAAGTESDSVQADKVERTFSISLVVSAVRCTLTYVLIPWIFPLLGIASGVGPLLGLVIGVAAIIANLFSIRRFHRADHRWKWPVTALCSGIIVLLAILVVSDIARL